jgi:uncharacterized protein
MTTPRKAAIPVFRALTDDESRDLLCRNHVGRVCFINNGQPDIEPVHYVANGEWIFIRSAAGTKLTAIAHHPYVAFEVDEIDGTFDWRSVVARGTIYLLPPEGTRIEREELERAVQALRSFDPAALTAEDPTPKRQTVYGIHINSVSGRSATMRGS